jgi:hypothetical protein
VGVQPDICTHVRKFSEWHLFREHSGRHVFRLFAASPRRKRRDKLDELVASISPENRHEEIDFGPPVGNEFQ